MTAAFHSSICKWALCTYNARFAFVGGRGAISVEAGSSLPLSVYFELWQHSTRCFLPDSIEGQHEDSSGYQYVSLGSTVLNMTESSSSSEYSRCGHLSLSMHWDTRPCRILKECAFPVVHCTYIQVHLLLR